MIRCLIADDHPIVRRGLAALVGAQSDFAPPAETATARETLERVDGEAWDLLVLDLNLPDANGIDVLRRIRRRHPDLPVLILSAHSEAQFAVRSLRAGASGYLNKGQAADELIVAIRRVLAGRRYISAGVAELLAASLDPDGASREPLETLSDREFQVLRLLGRGLSVSGIAAELNLSVKTVSTYRARLLDKLRLGSTAELVAYAIRHDLVDPA